jgi:hypothetical protein
MPLRIPAVSLAVLALAATGARAQVAPAVPPAPAAASLTDAVAKGRFILESRLRYEAVDQAKTARLTDNAEAWTLRTRFGWRSGSLHGLQVLVEGSNVARTAPERFAVNVPGSAGPPLNGADKARYPLVNDPSTTELNRAQLTWTPSKNLSATVGRQRIIVDDQRFVGNIGWRQDEQTFDAARLDLKLGKASLFYAYVDRVNRVLGRKRDWRTDAHLLNARYDFTKAYAAEGFVYLLDARNGAGSSTATWGARGTGRSKLGPLALAYEATYARQTDYGNQPADFALDFYDAQIAATHGIATLRLDYQELGGNGRRGFVTPLATAHAFNGWSDAFATPDGNKGFVDGLRDYNAALVLRPKWKLGLLAKPELTVWRHDFTDSRFGAHLGGEWDLQATANLTDKVQLLAKYADFHASRAPPAGAAIPPASRSKFWLSVEFKL